MNGTPVSENHRDATSSATIGSRLPSCHGDTDAARGAITQDDETHIANIGLLAGSR